MGGITRITVNTLRPRQNGRRFTYDTSKRIFLNENVRISIKISLKFVPKGPINNNPALVQIMAWRRPGDKPLSETMMVRLLTHICVTRPQWVKGIDGTTRDQTNISVIFYRPYYFLWNADQEKMSDIYIAFSLFITLKAPWDGEYDVRHVIATKIDPRIIQGI